MGDLDNILLEARELNNYKDLDLNIVRVFIFENIINKLYHNIGDDKIDKNFYEFFETMKILNKYVEDNKEYLMKEKQEKVKIFCVYMNKAYKKIGDERNISLIDFK